MFLKIAFIIILILLIFNLYLYIFGNKIYKLEDKINSLFKKRLGIVPSLFDVSKKDIVKHDSVFSNILNYLKTETVIYNSSTYFSERIYVESLIHHELDFLFKVFNKNDKLIHNYKFIYLRDLTINNSFEIGKSLRIYKQIIKKYNNLIKINKIFLLGYLFPFEYKKEI